MSRKKSRLRVGAKLRKARERHGISLRQVAEATKISGSCSPGARTRRTDLLNCPAAWWAAGSCVRLQLPLTWTPKRSSRSSSRSFLTSRSTKAIGTAAEPRHRQRTMPRALQVRIRLESASPFRVAGDWSRSCDARGRCLFRHGTPTAWLTSTENRSTRVAAGDDVTLSITRSVPLPALAQTYIHSIPSIVPLLLSAVSSDSAALTESAGTSGEEPADTGTHDPL